MFQHFELRHHIKPPVKFHLFQKATVRLNSQIRQSPGKRLRCLNCKYFIKHSSMLQFFAKNSIPCTNLKNSTPLNAVLLTDLPQHLHPWLEDIFASGIFGSRKYMVIEIAIVCRCCIELPQDLLRRPRRQIQHHTFPAFTVVKTVLLK